MKKILSLIILFVLITGCTYNFQPASLTYTDNSHPGSSATYTSTTY